MLTIEQKDFFAKSSCGFKLEDRHFVAVFKTRLLKYKDYVVSEHGYGNIVSYTGIFAAFDKADAEQKSLSRFHLFNPTFSPLRRDFMKVEHSLIEVKDVVPPYPSGDFSHIHQLLYSPERFWSHVPISVHSIKKRPMPDMPEPFHGTFWIRRIQKHLDSETADAYLCHPWRGAGDNGADWWRIPNGDWQFGMMEELFFSKNNSFEDQFNNTEYTDLTVQEQELVKNKTQLDYLDNQHRYFLGCDDLGSRDLSQGRYLVQQTYKGEIITDIFFREDESNWLRRCYIKGDDRKIELRKTLQALELQKNMVNSEIKRIKKALKE